RARLDPELLDQQPAALAVRGERVRLAPAAVEREHQLSPRLLAQRLGGDELRQLADEPLVQADLELGVDPSREGVEAEVLQPPREQGARLSPRQGRRPLERPEQAEVGHGSIIARWRSAATASPACSARAQPASSTARATARPRPR